MMFVTFDGARVGLVARDGVSVHDVTGLLPNGDVLSAIEAWDTVRPRLEAAASEQPALPLAQIHLEAPIPNPRRNIFCVGKNYNEHVSEFGRSGYDTADRSEDLPTRPIIFSKATTAVIGPSSDIEPHRDLTNEVDYEGELAVVIGPGGYGISREHAMAHVWGYTIVNDVTARDLQRDHRQWLLGKSLDTYCPMGPYLATADEVTDLPGLQIRTTVNGELRQQAHIRDLIFDIPELIATLSAGLTLLPGDVLATGTPAGVGIGFDPPRFLSSGDVVEVAITSLGALRNRIR